MMDNKINQKFKMNRVYQAPHNSAEARWESKPIHQRKCIYDVVTNQAQLSGIGTLDISSEMLWDHKPTLCLTINMDVEDMRPRPTSNIRIGLNGNDWRAFNRVSLWVYPEAQGFQNFYFHFSIQNQGSPGFLHAPSLIANRWNHVLFEITDVVRDKVQALSITPYLFGCPPEALPEVAFYFSNMYIEAVEPDTIFGWSCDNRIAYCHSGYLKNAKKEAIVSNVIKPTFILVDEANNMVFKNQATKKTTPYGEFYTLDFTNFTTEGQYKLQIDDKQTPYFSIGTQIFQNAIALSQRFLYLLRCGYDVQGVHSPCHLEHHTAHPDGRLVGDHGGWHDAGDVSQFEICTAEMAHALLDCARSLDNKNPSLLKQLKEEARWGLLWLLKTHFGDGYRALAVHYGIWRRDYLRNYQDLNPKNDTVHKNTAENGPFENFLAAMALIRGYQIFINEDEVFAKWCLRIGMQDFTFGLEGYKQGLFTERWGKGPEVQVVGALIEAACMMYEVTNEQLYLDIAAIYADVIVASQQITMPDWEKPIRGFFYEDPSHKTILTYEHRGHEQSPICGMVALVSLFPTHKDVAKWQQCIDLYVEYIKSSLSYMEPYGLLPAHVYRMEWLNYDRFTIPRYIKEQGNVDELFASQIKEGIHLGENTYLRRFPIAIQRRGFHATLLSKAKGISAIARLRQDKDLMQIAINQIEWILGKNPFASSTMYEEGHNYHPLYVAFSPQLTGALPVGIKTFEQFDAPYWPTANNAVYKEVWGHTTGKFLWVLADILQFDSK